jgi:hypothetical protein
MSYRGRCTIPTLVLLDVAGLAWEGLSLSPAEPAGPGGPAAGWR